MNEKWFKENWYKEDCDCVACSVYRVRIKNRGWVKTEQEIRDKIQWLDDIATAYLKEGRLDQISFTSAHRAVLLWVLGDSELGENREE